MMAVGLRILREEGVTHGRSGGSSMSCRDLNSEHQFQKQSTGGKKDEYILWDKKGWHVDARGAASEIRTLNIFVRNTTLNKKGNAWQLQSFEF